MNLHCKKIGLLLVKKVIQTIKCECMQKVFKANFKLIRLPGDILNCLGKTIKYFDAQHVVLLALHGINKFTTALSSFQS